MMGRENGGIGLGKEGAMRFSPTFYCKPFLYLLFIINLPSPVGPRRTGSNTIIMTGRGKEGKGLDKG